jgi:hypothetical protein
MAGTANCVGPFFRWIASPPYAISARRASPARNEWLAGSSSDFPIFKSTYRPLALRGSMCRACVPNDGHKSGVVCSTRPLNSPQHAALRVDRIGVRGIPSAVALPLKEGCHPAFDVGQRR